MNDKYPQWLFVILQNDYGDDDNYWYDVDTSDEKFKEAYLRLRGLKRKYSDYAKWRSACAIYDEYIDDIIEHNGGPYAVQSMFKSDIIPEGWVPRPKLKNKKSNKEILNSGITLSKVEVDADDIHIINELASEENKLTDAIRESIPNEIRKPKGITKAAINKSLDITEEKQRIASMYKNRGSFDVLSTYYSDAELREENERTRSLAEMFDSAVTDMFIAENDDGWRFTDSRHDDRHVDYYCGALIKNADRCNLDVARKIFQDNDIVVFDTSNMSKEKVRLYRSEFGVEFDPKTRKKAEKELKKYQKDRDKRAQASLDLARSLARNQDAEIDLSNAKFTLNEYRKKFKK